MSITASHERKPEILQVWRCPRCGRILARLALSAGSVLEIRCGKCHIVAVMQIVFESEAIDAG